MYPVYTKIQIEMTSAQDVSVCTSWAWICLQYLCKV